MTYAAKYAIGSRKDVEIEAKSGTSKNEASVSLRVLKVLFKTVAVRFKAEAFVEPVTVLSMYTA